MLAQPFYYMEKERIPKYDSRGDKRFAKHLLYRPVIQTFGIRLDPVQLISIDYRNNSFGRIHLVFL